MSVCLLSERVLLECEILTDPNSTVWRASISAAAGIDELHDALLEAVRAGRRAPAKASELLSATAARDLIGCSDGTLRSYARGWEAAFGPLPRNNGRRLFAISLVRIFQIVFIAPASFKRDLANAMYLIGREFPEFLLEIARQYIVSPVASKGKAEYAAAILLFVQGCQLAGSNDEDEELAPKETGAANPETAERLDALEEWIQKADTVIHLLGSLLQTTSELASGHLIEMASQAGLRINTTKTSAKM